MTVRKSNLPYLRIPRSGSPPRRDIRTTLPSAKQAKAAWLQAVRQGKAKKAGPCLRPCKFGWARHIDFSSSCLLPHGWSKLTFFVVDSLSESVDVKECDICQRLLASEIRQKGPALPKRWGKFISHVPHVWKLWNCYAGARRTSSTHERWSASTRVIFQESSRSLKPAQFMAEKEDEYADIRDGLQEVEAKLPALGFDLPTPFDQTSLDAEAPDSDMLLHTLDMGPLAVPIPLSTPVCPRLTPVLPKEIWQFTTSHNRLWKPSQWSTITLPWGPSKGGETFEIRCRFVFTPCHYLQISHHILTFNCRSWKCPIRACQWTHLLACPGDPHNLPGPHRHHKMRVSAHGKKTVCLSVTFPTGQPLGTTWTHRVSSLSAMQECCSWLPWKFSYVQPISLCIDFLLLANQHTYKYLKRLAFNYRCRMSRSEQIIHLSI